jgi:hypothetical protein
LRYNARMNQPLPALSLIAFVLAAPSARAQKVKIEVRAEWQGLAHSRRNKLVIKGVDGKYQGDGKPIDPAAVDALLHALHEPPLHKISADTCGLNDAWIAANADRAFAQLTTTLPNKPAPAQMEFFRSQFTVTNVQAYLDSFKYITVMDDDTDVELKVSLDNEVIILHSGSNLQFLLPWQDSENEHRNFNCRVSTTLGALLPRDFVNQQRLLRDSPRFLREVAEFVIREKETDWNALGPPRYTK